MGSQVSILGFGREQTVEANIGAIVEPSCSLGNQADGINCSVDLKLGGSGGSEPPLERKNQSIMAMMTASSLTSPSKRARAPSTACLVVSCSVDGCKADLNNCREYHRRHKVCEIHSKTPIVVVRGVEQRFCQQCSSCRKRLMDTTDEEENLIQNQLVLPPCFQFSKVPGCQRLLGYLNLLLQSSTGLELLKLSKMHSTLISQLCISTKVNNTFLDPVLPTIKRGSSSLSYKMETLHSAELK